MAHGVLILNSTYGAHASTTLSSGAAVERWVGNVRGREETGL